MTKPETTAQAFPLRRPYIKRQVGKRSSAESATAPASYGNLAIDLDLFAESDSSGEIIVEQLEEEIGTATAQVEQPEVEIDRELHALLSSARNEYFEDGMQSSFSSGLLSFVTGNGNAAIESLTVALLAESNSIEVISESLRWTGRVQQPSTRVSRRRLLELMLRHQSARVRDGAILGLASMNDPYAIRAVVQAIQREHVIELKKNMVDVLVQLRETQAERLERATDSQGD